MTTWMSAGRRDWSLMAGIVCLASAFVATDPAVSQVQFRPGPRCPGRTTRRREHP